MIAILILQLIISKAFSLFFPLQEYRFSSEEECKATFGVPSVYHQVPTSQCEDIKYQCDSKGHTLVYTGCHTAQYYCECPEERGRRSQKEVETGCTCTTCVCSDPITYEANSCYYDGVYEEWFKFGVCNGEIEDTAVWIAIFYGITFVIFVVIVTITCVYRIKNIQYINQEEIMRGFTSKGIVIAFKKIFWPYLTNFYGTIFKYLVLSLRDEKYGIFFLSITIVLIVFFPLALSGAFLIVSVILIYEGNFSNWSWITSIISLAVFLGIVVFGAMGLASRNIIEMYEELANKTYKGNYFESIENKEKKKGNTSNGIELDQMELEVDSKVDNKTLQKEEVVVPEIKE